MTNEQLAALAQQPENEELVPLLWEKVKPLLWLKAKQAYNARQSVFQQCGVELWDIRQGCYTAFLSALKGYKPETGIKFISYLSYPFHTLLAELTGTRSTKREPLNEAASLDMPIKNQSEEGKVTLADILPDKGTDIETAVLSQLEQDEESRLVHEAVDRLPERLREVIELYFFQGVFLVDIAQRWGCTYQNVSNKKSKSFAGAAAFFGAARTAAGIPSTQAVERCAAYGILARSFRSCAAVQRIAEKPAAGCVPCAVGFLCGMRFSFYACSLSSSVYSMRSPG